MRSLPQRSLPRERAVQPPEATGKFSRHCASCRASKDKNALLSCCACAAAGGHGQVLAALRVLPCQRGREEADEVRALPDEVVLQPGVPEGALEEGPQALLRPGARLVRGCLRLPSAYRLPSPYRGHICGTLCCSRWDSRQSACFAEPQTSQTTSPGLGGKGVNPSHGWPNTMKKPSCAPCILCPIGPSSSLNVCTATRSWR